MVSGLLRLALLQLISEAIWSGLVSEAWDVDALSEIKAKLRELHLLSEYQGVIDSERGFLNDFYERLLAGGPTAADAIYLISDRYSQDRIILQMAPRGWVHASRLRSNLYTDAAMPK